MIKYNKTKRVVQVALTQMMATFYHAVEKRMVGTFGSAKYLR